MKPTPDNIVVLKLITPIIGEALVYCISTAVEENQPGCVAYDAHTDMLTYHRAITSLDSDLFDMLKGISDIWIEVDAGVES